MQKLGDLATKMEPMSADERVAFRLSTDVRAMPSGPVPNVTLDADADTAAPAEDAAAAGTMAAPKVEVMQEECAATDNGGNVGLDERNPKERELNMVQEQHISDVYGEHGDKMVAALYENPADAVPIVAGRLVAKGAEWSKVCYAPPLAMLHRCTSVRL